MKKPTAYQRALAITGAPLCLCGNSKTESVPGVFGTTCDDCWNLLPEDLQHRLRIGHNEYGFLKLYAEVASALRLHGRTAVPA